MTTPSLPGRRERKILETRRALERATLTLALAHGLDEVTVEQIADHADVSPRTFFNYFASKENAVLGRALWETEDGLLADFPSGPDSEAVWPRLRTFITEQFTTFLEADDLLEKRMAVLRENAALAHRQRSQMAALLDQLTARVAWLLAEERGLAILEPDPELVTEARMLLQICGAAVACALDSWWRNGRDTGGILSLEEAFRLLERTAAHHITIRP